MIHVSFVNNVVDIGGHHIAFDSPVLEVATVCDIAVVLLQPMKGRRCNENVFGVGADGTILWQIESIPETSMDPLEYYAGVAACDESSCSITLGNWGGTSVIVDVRSGKVLKSWFTK